MSVPVTIHLEGSDGSARITLKRRIIQAAKYLGITIIRVWDNEVFEVDVTNPEKLEAVKENLPPDLQELLRNCAKDLDSAIQTIERLRRANAQLQQKAEAYDAVNRILGIVASANPRAESPDEVFCLRHTLDSIESALTPKPTLEQL